MSRHDRGLKAAVKAAFMSEFYDHRVGAALFKGARLLALGSNFMKSHPQNRCWSRHAEFSTLFRFSAEQLEGSTLYVARLTRTNRVSCAKPCPDCQEIILEKGISKVFYTNYSGVLERLNLNSLILEAS